MHRMTERCFYMSGDHATDRPSLGYVRGDRYALAVDGGNSPAHWRLMASALGAAGLPQPNLCAVTHSHWDHVYGLHAMDAQVIACRATQAQLARMSAWRWDAASMQARLDSGEDILFCHEN
ncbi:MAG: MBL fold metallo-hydrolase, partial [Clostridia bacterium]|nr:MBL fold metallo-hydrolase [Clostridia bacterium]